MSSYMEQLDKPTFKGAKCRKRWSYKQEKTAYSRLRRRKAKQDPENAPQKNQYRGWFW